MSRPASAGRPRLTSRGLQHWLVFERRDLRRARRARANFAHDNRAVTARVIHPLALPTSLRRMPVSRFAPWVLDLAGLNHDPVTGSTSCRYTTTDFASVHSSQPRSIHREVGWDLATSC